jgi:glycosyltransferase involved in cell wall biosynthesis
LNIALDATYSRGSELSGVGVYSQELLSGLAAAHPEARFRFCYRSQRYFASFRSRLPANARRFLLGEDRAPRSADLFHGLNQRLPRVPLRRAVATFHDLFVLTGDYSTPEFRTRFAEQARQAAARADLIIAVSQFTASQVVDLLGVDTGRVRVVHHGVRSPVTMPPQARENVILHVGAIQRRKNIARLVEAFERVDRDWQLVLAGSNGYGAPEILKRIACSTSRERIRVLGYVPATELGEWYKRAAIFAFPSLDEGFGMPVLEAMAVGTPVVASNRSAMPEVAGTAAWLVDPESGEELANALMTLTRDPDRRTELASLGLTRASQFSWDRAVEQTWNHYCELLNVRPS